MKIALGSAQFGMPYGISNHIGKVPDNQVSEILGFASKSNIKIIDTAITYGNSEELLGRFDLKHFKVVTKLPKIPETITDVKAWAEREIYESLNRLKIESLHGLLLHDLDSLFDKDSHQLVTTLETMKTSGLINKLGVSIYNPNDLNRIIDLINLDIVQAPLNLIDRRLLTSRWLEKLKLKGIEVHTRSSFLQGLLLLQPNTIPESFKRWSHIFEPWHQELTSKNLNPISECLNFVLNIPEVDHVIVGVETIKQLEGIVKISQDSNQLNDWDFMQCDDEELINPSKWVNS